MRALTAVVLALAALTLLAGSAQAQQQGSMTVQLNVPEEPLVDGKTLTITGTVTLVADWTVAASPSGIPVTYTITEAPEWASVVVSPATDIFPVGAPVGLQPAYTGTRTVTIIVTLAEEKAEDASGAIELTATTSPSFGGTSLTGRGTTLVAYDAPDEPCPDHFSEEQLAALKAEAVDMYNAHQAEQARADDPEDVTVQSTGASPLSTSWMAVGGLALVGAGVGLVLRRRFG